MVDLRERGENIGDNMIMTAALSGRETLAATNAQGAALGWGWHLGFQPALAELSMVAQENVSIINRET